MPPTLLACLTIVLLSVAPCLAADAPRSSLGLTRPGMLIVYPIADLTEGQEPRAAELAALLRETCQPDAWQGSTPQAALRITPMQLAVEAQSNVHQAIGDLLKALRSPRNQFLVFEYELITLKQPLPPPSESPVLFVPTTHPQWNVQRVDVGPSQIAFRQGSHVLLLHGSALDLPTLSVEATVSADARAFTLSLQARDATASEEAIPPKTYSLPFDVPLGLPIAGTDDRQWLVLQPMLATIDWTPIHLGGHRIPIHRIQPSPPLPIMGAMPTQGTQAPDSQLIPTGHHNHGSSRESGTQTRDAHHHHHH